MKLSILLARAGKAITDNSPLILTGAAVVGITTTGLLAGRAGFKAGYKTAVADENGKGPTDWEEVFRDTWKGYIPAVGVGALSITSIVFANRIGTRRAAAMAAAYQISSVAFDEYRDKIVEKVGEKKEKAFRDEVAQERIAKDDPKKRYVIKTGGGTDLCYDLWNGRYFYSSMETIKQAQNAINYKINHQFYASATDFYDRLMLDRTKTSDDIGWSNTNQLEVIFTTTVDNDGHPVLVMDFLADPIRGFQRVH